MAQVEWSGNALKITDRFEARSAIAEDGSVAYVAYNHVSGYPLYAWWVIAVSVYEPGEIEGTLTDDIRSAIAGPFASEAEACGYIDGLLSYNQLT